jgi:queuine tRNA-ribosyltransferase
VSERWNGAPTGEVGCEVVTTRSGARAMRDKATGQLMHPIVGPTIEALELYVKPSRLEERLRQESPRPLVLLEVGLGAGSNAIAAWKVSEALPPGARRLEIVSFERTLAPFELAMADENAAAFGFEGESLQAARAVLASGRHETPRTTWRLVVGELPAAFDGEADESADLVFWDPFSPRVNAELWTVASFVAVRRLCHPRSTLLTYSAATAARSALLLAGFAVGVGTAKREGKKTTEAAVTPADVQHPLDRRWLERLARSSAPFPPDAPEEPLAKIAAMPQFSISASP